MKDTTILIVDDNPEIREILRILLTAEQYQVTEAADGIEALKCLKSHTFDLIILDIMMPHMNGYQTCLEIRNHSNAPILFLSAKTKDSDKTLGFSSGGDDYLAKPFSYSELLGRTKALLRRYQVYQGKPDAAEGGMLPREKSTSPSCISFHDLEIVPDERAVYRDGIPLDLTDTEYALLFVLVQHRGQIFSAEHLYETVWEEVYYYGANNTVMVHIRNLRQKIEPDPKNPVLIKTIWGRGYRCD